MQSFLAPASASRSASLIAGLAHGALIDELEAWPKPGLVSLIDSGSHSDMDADTLRRSAGAIAPFFAELVEAGTIGASLLDLRRIGLAAEAAMLDATGGVNAHRGAIFSLGLICAAAGRAGERRFSAEDWADRVREGWGREISRQPASPVTHGGRAALRYGVGGASAEAAEGFPTVREIGLPALRRGRRLAPDDGMAPRIECLFALMAHLDDTNLLHRGGAEGLAFAQRSARRFLDAGGVGRGAWREEALTLHRAFVAARLSPGGSADLLAVTLFLDSLATD